MAYVKVGNELYFGESRRYPFSELHIPNVNRHETAVTISDEKINGNSVGFIYIKLGDKNWVMPIVNREIAVPKGTKIPRVPTETVRKDETQVITRGLKTPITVNVEEQISEQNRENLMVILNEFKNCFASNLRELGCTDLIAMYIIDNNIPVRGKPYRTSAKEREVVKETVRERK